MTGDMPEGAEFSLEDMDRELAELGIAPDEAANGRVADEALPEGSEDFEADVVAGPNGRQRLLDPSDVDGYEERWQKVQAGFVDEPRRAVEHADQLVDVVLNRLTRDLREERDALVRRWDRGAENISTEELRLSLKGYRRLLDRLMRL